jgi:hypothetical protein
MSKSTTRQQATNHASTTYTRNHTHPYPTFPTLPRTTLPSPLHHLPKHTSLHLPLHLIVIPSTSSVPNLPTSATQRRPRETMTCADQSLVRMYIRRTPFLTGKNLPDVSRGKLSAERIRFRVFGGTARGIGNCLEGCANSPLGWAES